MSRVIVVVGKPNGESPIIPVKKGFYCVTTNFFEDKEPTSVISDYVEVFEKPKDSGRKIGDVVVRKTWVDNYEEACDIVFTITNPEISKEQVFYGVTSVFIEGMPAASRVTHRVTTCDKPNAKEYEDGGAAVRMDWFDDEEKANAHATSIRGKIYRRC